MWSGWQCARLGLHQLKILNTLVYVAPKIPQVNSPYHEPWSPMDVLSGDGQEQDGQEQCKHQQHNQDGTSEAMSHEVKVSSKPPFSVARIEMEALPKGAGRKLSLHRC